jgi:hypothetical protein
MHAHAQDDRRTSPGRTRFGFRAAGARRTVRHPTLPCRRMLETHQRAPRVRRAHLRIRALPRCERLPILLRPHPLALRVGADKRQPGVRPKHARVDSTAEQALGSRGGQLAYDRELRHVVRRRRW